MSAKDMRAWVHSGSGALLAGYTALHLWELSAATRGREAFVERMSWRGSGVSGGFAIAAVLGLLLLVHGAMGALRIRADGGGPGPYATRDARRLQWLTAALAATFVVAHLAQVWGAAGVGGADARAAYDRLRIELGRPGWLSLYVVGLGAVFLHLAGGLTAAFDAHWAGVSPQVGRLRRVLVHVGAATAFLVASHQVGYFASGAGTFAAPVDTLTAGASPAGPAP